MAANQSMTDPSEHSRTMTTLELDSMVRTTSRLAVVARLKSGETAAKVRAQASAIARQAVNRHTPKDSLDRERLIALAKEAVAEELHDR